MQENETPLVALQPGTVYSISNGECYVIHEGHTLADIIRFCGKKASYAEVIRLAKLELQKQNNPTLLGGLLKWLHVKTKALMTKVQKMT